MSQQEEGLTVKLGDMLERKRTGPKGSSLSAFGPPMQGRPQKQEQFGYNNDGRTYVGPRKENKIMVEKEIVGEVRRISENTVAEQLKKARDAGDTVSRFDAADLTAAVSVHVLSQLEKKWAEREEKAAEAAKAAAASTVKNAFARNRLEKLEDAGFNALGMATGITIGGIAALSLKKVLGL